jgi:protein transport protein SEC24
LFLSPFFGTVLTHHEQKAGRGGHLVLFTSSIPNVGAGALSLSPPSEAEHYGTDKEKVLYLPRNRTWRDIGEEMVEEGVGASLFFGMGKFIDIGSIGGLLLFSDFFGC